MKRYAAQIKKWLVVAWLLVPVVLISYHYGPGQQALAWREAAAHRDAARAAEKLGHWEQAAAAYGEAVNAVPSTDDDASAAALSRDQLRLAQIRAAFQLGNLNDTLTDLGQFVEQVEANHGAGSPVAFDARDLLGRVHYQAMIALRLESAEKQVWMQQWELARQNFRFLAEQSARRRNSLDRKNLEVVIKSANLPPLPTIPPPTGGGSSSTTPRFSPPTPPTPTSATAPPDNRRPTKSISEVTPPEFERGS